MDRRERRRLISMAVVITLVMMMVIVTLMVVMLVLMVLMEMVIIVMLMTIVTLKVVMLILMVNNVVMTVMVMAIMSSMAQPPRPSPKPPCAHLLPQKSASPPALTRRHGQSGCGQSNRHSRRNRPPDANPCAPRQASLGEGSYWHTAVAVSFCGDG